MGDRTYVRLQVLASQKETVGAILVEYGESVNQEYEVDTLYGFCFEEVSYRYHEFLSDLQKAGVAYDSSWDNGHEYTYGAKSSRYTSDGEIIIKEIYNIDLNLSIFDLLKRIDNHEELRKYILDHHEKTTSIPIDENQLEYGKLYRAKKLITSG